ncbi:trypsin-like serine peptidase [Corallococcus macrosporus]|uniref:Protease n=2 Tax=Myxococcaceae TaxID=31 RepID=A0A250JTI6_9BACT|nr:serine protease [Corallococcus macrosporus]AEI66228.1 protease A [Corallococcus macrosporus]ATB47145.1 protease [Corallococcus macrosporus DSM 14697]
MARRPTDSKLTLWGSRLAGAVLLSLAACGGRSEQTEPAVCEPPSRPEVRGFAQCGPTLDFTPINSYVGEFSDVIQDREDAVVLIDGRCTGTLIEASAGPVVLTAGHCVRTGDIPLVVFNFEDDEDGDTLITEGLVIEQADAPDYALIQLDALPAVTPIPLTTQVTERLAIVQHPRGYPKVIAEGAFLDTCDQLLFYKDLDTLVASSGAGVLNRQGHLLGVHTDGDCEVSGRGTNRGWTVESIVEASEYLQASDLAER